MTKYVFVTGGVVSSIEKGIVTASLGRLLKNRDLEVTIQKFDPYINVDPGTMSPYQHGEVFVTDDSVETDLDLGHYERFIDINLNKCSNVMTGKVYSEVLRKERKDEYLGATVQVIPHITNEIKEKIMRAARMADSGVIIIEVEGTVGDIESLPFLEALCQMKADVGTDNIMYIHITLIPYLKAAGEIKTKSTQYSVKELCGLGIQSNILVVRAEQPVSQSVKNKLAQFCGVEPEAVIESPDIDMLYSVPLVLQARGMDQVVCDHLKLDTPEVGMTEWKELEEHVLNLKEKVRIALVGKYVELPDACVSVVEALEHSGFAYSSDTEVDWIRARELTRENVEERLKDADGILVPGGFGNCGVEGKIEAIRYARENDVPFLGTYLGMRMAYVKFARNVVGLEDALSAEASPDTANNIIDLMADRENIENLGGTLHLGSYPCKIKKGTKTAKAYDGADVVQERHRHRYEFNNKYRQLFEEQGLVFSGVSPDNRLVEIAELSEKKFFVGCQFRPELISRPNRPQKLIKTFVGASLADHETK